MKRLVYSPKVSAYIQTEDGVLDITDYIVSGNVQRVVNEVSTAELTIRNPNKRFTTPGNPTFRPMDGITIFASRYRDRPVQVFTGYLDQTPYLQLFPGTCTLKASCTLKRLLYTYWDPALGPSRDLLWKYNWIPNLQTGQIQNPSSQGNQKQNVNPQEHQMGSVGDLMFGVLNEIGNWRKDQILIEEFPEDAGKVVEAMVTNISNNTDIAEEEFKKFLENMIGPYSGGAAVGADPGAGTGAATGGGVDIDAPSPPPRTVVTPEQAAIEMLRAGFPADAQIIANGLQTMEVESGFGAYCVDDGWGVNDYGCCAGYWQIYLSVHNVPLECANDLACATRHALGFWKGAGNCFACQPGPNPWQGGTDNATKYLDVAQKVLDLYVNNERNEDHAPDQINPGHNTD